jgi:hypothetical protein
VTHRSYDDDDGNRVEALDAEGIDYLITGLEQLRDLKPGEEICTPALTEETDDGTITAGYHVLRRLPDE